MLYLGIDQHRKQLTVCVRNEEGDVMLRRQVSTEWDRVRAFGAEIRKLAGPAGFVVIVEVCGFNDWLLKLLAEYDCRETFVVQPEKQSKKKTDRRDANALCEILWLNRQRLLDGKPVQGVRVVHLPSVQDAADRQLTELRKRVGQLRTRTINKLKHLLRKHNLEQESPTKGLETVKAKKWLATLALETMDRLEMDLALTQWKQWDEQIETLDAAIRKRQAKKRTGGVAGDDSRLRGLQQPGLGVADRRYRAFPAAGEPGQLLGPHAGLPQLGRGHGPAGLDHQARQRHGAVHPWAVGVARAAARRGDAVLVRPDQEAAGLEDRPGGGDAPVGDNYMAYG
jgi:transposase